MATTYYPHGRAPACRRSERKRSCPSGWLAQSELRLSLVQEAIWGEPARVFRLPPRRETPCAEPHTATTVAPAANWSPLREWAIPSIDVASSPPETEPTLLPSQLPTPSPRRPARHLRRYRTRRRVHRRCLQQVRGSPGCSSLSPVQLSRAASALSLSDDVSFQVEGELQHAQPTADDIAAPSMASRSPSSRRITGPHDPRRLDVSPRRCEFPHVPITRLILSVSSDSTYR